MSWIYLLIAGVFEIGWPLGMKLSQTQPGYRIPWIAFSVLSMGLSGWFLWLAQRTIPMGTAYAIWTGIGAAGAFTAGVLLFRDPVSLFRMLSVLLIIAGIVGLKLSSG